MSALSSWLWGTPQLDYAIDKATSELLPTGSEDIALNLEICDQIRSKSIPAKDAMRALKRRLNHSNPNVQLLALNLTDICVKNGGDLFLNEIASREFIDNLISILKMQTLNHDVKSTILRLIQNWSVAFEGKYNLSYVGQAYKELVKEGFKFPPKDLAVANSAMVDTQTAPEWIDSDVCLRCRTAFTFTNRKHHCRNCGQVFDQQCSSKTMPLPHFGITQEVRVCDGCYNKLLKKAQKSNDSTRKQSYSHNPRDLNIPGFDDDLQRAIQLSLQEATASGSQRRPGYVPAQPSQWQYSEPPIVERPSYAANDDDDLDLKAAIEASLREANAPKPSAPIAPPTPRDEERPYSYDYRTSSATPTPLPPLPKLPSYDLDPLESDAILTFSQTVEQLQAQGGRDLSRYPGVNELYDKASGLRPKLALSLDDAGRKEEMLADMHDKLSQAVKLYDQLLTEQVMHPRWRSPQSMAAHQAQASSVNGVASGFQPQWTAGNPQGASTGYTPVEAPHSPQTAYSRYPGHQQPQYGQVAEQYPPETPISSQTTPAPPQHQGYTDPSQYHYSASTPTPSQNLSPRHAAPQMQMQHQTPISMASAVKSPPPPITSHLASVPESPHLSPSLGRSNSISSYAPNAQAHQAGNTHLGRSHSISVPSARMHQQKPAQSVHQQHQQQHHYQRTPQAPPQQQQQQQAYAMPPSGPPQQALPHFPSVPTTTLPQPSSVYGSSLHSGVVETEGRKEAMLIDL
ncbi:hypothetical protein AMATHDRAFT_65883 [Amanita thiersii Skay4041]|uniref:Vacuolar protein sorting-associated protein 27 n=1 Tax=Amanita thiersii Skay4041 TaxID=703135 RepID=A0A2A9NKQ6_9AGAR|nr:hypothetical protein AMATHDRAFT_65883 [Amanita thiersii Skay4041]